MNNHSTDKSRRAILKGIVSLPVVAIAGYHGASQAAPLLTTDDPTAKALQYTQNSTTEGRQCANCNLYQGGDAAQGACTIFPGKEVMATGWCASWIAKM